MPLADFDHRPSTRIVFGSGSLCRLGELAKELGGSRVLVVSDRGVQQAGHTERGIDVLKAAGLQTFAFYGVEENPTTSHVEAALEVARAAQIDFLVGLGGGSSIDTAKGVNFLYSNGGKMADYWGNGKASLPMLPMIAVPTTAGTGSEAQSFALIADASTHRKMACGDPKASCKAAILDPEVTLSQPSRVCAVSGIDALSHAIETWVTTKRTGISEMYSRAAWDLLIEGLPRVFADPTDIEARGQVLLGAHFAGAAIENSMLGAAHASANPLTARFGITHGAAIGLMLPHVIVHNAERCRTRYAALADSLLRRDAETVVEAGFNERCPESVLASFVKSLLAKAGLPTRLIECGIREESFALLAEDATREWTGTFNPRPMQSEDFVRLYRNAA